MAEPKCPECKTVGLEHIVSKESDEKSQGGDPWFDVVHCDECGHVYGVFAKITHQPRLKLQM
ncbi:transcriptional regulator [Paenibacillus jamilae]|uniref:transcriptional regulator n=1 Tax=Paenibacillus jamilae TaxID=114136 RepID=UPI00142B1073|nr:transcriptional regulator [Paenibacillus polymyxa]